MIALTRTQVRIAGEVLAWLSGRRRRIRVTGASMEPLLTEGQFVLVADRPPKVGEAALARHPERPELLVIKRVRAWTPDRRAELASDNESAGTDSRSWGPVAADLVLGTATVRLDQPMRWLADP
jgi:nickel-type superoxide dismutase maturation protease